MISARGKKNVADKGMNLGLEQGPTLSKAPAEGEPLTATEALGDIGFGTFVGWIVACFGGSAFPSADVAGLMVDGGLFPFVGLMVSMAVTALFMGKSNAFMKVPLRRLLLVEVLLALALPIYYAIISSGGPQMGLLYGASWLFNGIAVALGLLIWARYLWTIPSLRVAVRMMITAMLIAGSCIFFIGSLAAFAQSVGIIFMVVVNAACLMISEVGIAPRSYVDKEQTRRNCTLDMKTTVSLAITSMAQGYLMFIVFREGEGAFYVSAAALALVAGIMAVTKRIAGESGVFLAPVLRLVYPLLVAGFIILPFVGDVPLLIGEVVLLAVCFECWCALVVNVVQVKLKYEVQPYFFWARVNLPWAIGLTVGWLAAGAGYLLTGGYDAVQLVPTLVMAALLTMSTAITPYGVDRLTVFRDQGEGQDETDRSSPTGRSPHMAKAWHEACEQVAHEGGLTARETDIFMLLARGRNSKIIERELGISIHTIKSHNYNIYRKLDVESQQQLIDEVEQRRLKIWKPNPLDETSKEDEYCR